MKTNYWLKTLFFIFFLSVSGYAGAKVSALPRFASVKSSTVNVRSGPGVRYPISFIYKQKNTVVEIIAEFDVWLKIRDSSGDIGWVNGNMLSSRRYFEVTADSGAVLYEREGEVLNPIANLEKGVVGKLVSCSFRLDYCNVKVDKFEGVVMKRDIFGVYEYETVK